MIDRRRIAIVDDVAAIRNSVKALLETYGYEVDTFAGAEEFFDALPESLPSCVLFDVRMPGMNGLEAQRLMASRSPGLPVIIITGHGDIDMAVGAMKVGAFDFIEKPIDDQRLISSVESAIHHAMEVRQQERKRDEIRRKFERLTTRERDVLRLVAEGYSTLAIASMLSISARTVDHHRANIYSKLEITGLSQLIKLTLQAEQKA